MKTKEINNSQDFIDSRDIIERIEELTDLIEEEKTDEQEHRDITEEKEELEILLELAEEASISPDWKYGETLIRETYFLEYCQELLADIGDLPKELPHSIVIDWDQTAENLKVDYSTVDFDGVEYLIRS